jgi:hypothetical protein
MFSNRARGAVFPAPLWLTVLVACGATEPNVRHGAGATSGAITVGKAIQGMGWSQAPGDRTRASRLARSSPSGSITKLSAYARLAGASASSPWGPETQLSFTSSDSVPYHSVAGSGRTVHAVWGDGTVYYRQSVDKGSSWGPRRPLWSGSVYLTDPIVADGSNVYIAYIRNKRTITDARGTRLVGNLMLRYSRDSGATWGPEIPIATSGAVFRLSVAASGLGIHVAWQDFRSGVWDIFYRRSLDGGVTWEPEVRLIGGVAGLFGATRPQLSLADASVHLTWTDDRDRRPACSFESGGIADPCPEVYYKRSSDLGASWEADRRLTFGPGHNARSDIAATSQGGVVISYDHGLDTLNRQGLEQFALVSVDSGNSWQTPVRLSDALGDSTHGSLAASGSDVSLAWFDERRTGNTEIFGVSSTNGGLSWGPEQRISQGHGASLTPSVSATNEHAHVIWTDNRTGTRQKWYRRHRL